MEILKKATNLVERCAEKLKLKIVDVEYVTENNMNILRVIAVDDENLDIDQATDLNNLISEELDKEDFINEEYYLEVSSPGIERQLKTEEDIVKAQGKYICINTYEKIEGLKEIVGYLQEYQNKIVKIEINIKGRMKMIEIPFEKISKIRLAVKF